MVTTGARRWSIAVLRTTAGAAAVTGTVSAAGTIADGAAVISAAVIRAGVAVAATTAAAAGVAIMAMVAMVAMVAIEVPRRQISLPPVCRHSGPVAQAAGLFCGRRT